VSSSGREDIEEIFYQNKRRYPAIYTRCDRACTKNRALDLMNEQQKEFLEDLNPLNIEARYPDYESKNAQTMTKIVTQNILTNT